MADRGRSRRAPDNAVPTGPTTRVARDQDHRCARRRVLAARRRAHCCAAARGIRPPPAARERRRAGVDVTLDLAAALDAGRQRTLDLLAPFDDDFLRAQHSPLMSPLVWDLAHVGNYEEIWLVRSLGGDAIRPDIDDLYDAFRHPRAGRPTLPLLSPDEARSYIAEVRERASEFVDEPSFVHRMVVQHEHQHDETMLATIQLSGVEYEPPFTDSARVLGHQMPENALKVVAGGVTVGGGGAAVVGTSDDPWAYDNERPAHEVHLAPFEIDRAPVRNGEFLHFIAAGGYDDPRLWTS